MPADIIQFPSCDASPEERHVAAIMQQVSAYANDRWDKQSDFDRARDCVAVLNNSGATLAFELEMVEAALKSLNKNLSALTPSQQSQIIAGANKDAVLGLVLMVAAAKAGDFELALSDALKVAGS